MSSVSKNKKRKNKKKYFQSNKKHKTGVLEAGLKGFLITCNNEHMCVKEAYNLLNEFADDLYGPEFEATEKSSDSKELDIEEELNKEIEAMKTKKRRFQQVCTMVKGILFINTTVPDPTKLATSIFDNVLQTGKRRGRFILKMIPIIVTCKATQNDIRKHLDEHMQELIKNDENKKLTYRIESRIRHNNNISTSHVLWYVRESVEKFAPEWIVSLTEPQLVFSIQILRSICCIGILKNYMEYRKYNLSEAASINDKESSQINSQGDCDEKQTSSDEEINEGNVQDSDYKLQIKGNKDEDIVQNNGQQGNNDEIQAPSNKNVTSETEKCNESCNKNS
ncbi:THUMP domain-containing protein 1 [Argiope bruennichi]|uniref:THUMP domain-containing protein 1 n=1 Tax=Argiope bruennichi TaxID=94029 RepID=A0A8T0EL02_ARGBR|nr:THUMP domain-containing protein 1 [Argiope bruennichi]